MILGYGRPDITLATPLVDCIRSCHGVGPAQTARVGRDTAATQFGHGPDTITDTQIGRVGPGHYIHDTTGRDEEAVQLDNLVGKGYGFSEWTECTTIVGSGY